MASGKMKKRYFALLDLSKLLKSVINAKEASPTTTICEKNCVLFKKNA